MIRLIVFCLIISSIGGFEAKAIAQTPALQTVSRSNAASQATRIKLYPGRATAIDFSQTDEIIGSILLADQSQITYTTDYPVESNQAQTLFLRRIEELEFPGATEAVVTNLWVKTRSPDGTERLYAFDLVPSSGGGVGTVNGVQILPEEKVSPSPSNLADNTLVVSRNRQATTVDIEQGLQIAINRGYTPADDPVVLRVENFLIEVRNSSRSLQQAAQNNGLSLLVLTKLAELALEPPPLPEIESVKPAPGYPRLLLELEHQIQPRD